MTSYLFPREKKTAKKSVFQILFQLWFSFFASLLLSFALLLQFLSLQSEIYDKGRGGEYKISEGEKALRSFLRRRLAPISTDCQGSNLGIYQNTVKREKKGITLFCKG